MKIYFRHERLRKYQGAIMQDVWEALTRSHHLLLHAPVGLGKTDATLSPAITYSLEENTDVFFLTPKISQHKIAVEVIRDLSQKFDLSLPFADVVGKRYMCIYPAFSDLEQDSFYQACKKLKEREACPYYRKARGYTKYEQEKAKALFKEVVKPADHLEIYELGKKYEACPYEWIIELAKKARIVIADYFHILSPTIRKTFLARIGKTLDDAVVIIDEAHNLPKRVREQLSATINSFMLRRADKELEMLGEETLKLEKSFNSWAKERAKEKEVLVSREDFLEWVEGFGKIDELVAYFESVGLSWVEKTMRRSYCLKLSRFLEKWKEEEKGVVRILRKKEKFYSLSKRILDPSIATSELDATHSTILMSGTLLPLEMYRDVLGLDKERTMMREYPSPFPKENKINIIAKNITTRYSRRTAEEYKKYAYWIDRIAAVTPGGVAVFFASFEVLNGVVPYIKSRPLFVQKERMKPKEIHKLISRFTEEGGVLCAVEGGSLAEGVDYNKGQIKTVIIAGVALEEMNLETEALIDYYEEKFGKGWEYGYLYPAIIKALQAAGRAIRKPEDRAAIVFMDERFNWKNYRKLFPKDERFVITAQPDIYVRDFHKGVLRPP